MSGNFRYKLRDFSNCKPQSFEGTVMGIYSDAQSRILVEVSIIVNGTERLIKKIRDQLSFPVVIGQKVLVEFIPQKTSTMIVVKEKRN